MSDRVLVACVGNLLRHDDGFGVAVARELERRGVPDGVDLIETGIGGMSVVQQLMDGYRALVVVDAVDRDAAPGTVWVLSPEVEDPSAMDGDEWRTLFANLHLAEPSRIFLLARSLGVLPPSVTIVGCQPADIDTMDEQLSSSVAAAVPIAADRVEATVRSLTALIATGG
ncbi:MAG: hydrogenase maturation protease [Chloroflexi bacterium]|nr:hydrogenase maturation protease [Chloroflexota bacterium]